ncbi:hypothetical protein PoB_005015700 [Plakobranchus ocellatus]|uniref:Uncharacterized protein n=1 Tax=Plakobranchus ocellatus TaxID=259542 RepID=A0AAV4BWE4_9GAST|nr:hypothetical protein PoB_005015700 [Plakobranchus ocellatus]
MTTQIPADTYPCISHCQDHSGLTVMMTLEADVFPRTGNRCKYSNPWIEHTYSCPNIPTTDLLLPAILQLAQVLRRASYGRHQAIPASPSSNEISAEAGPVTRPIRLQLLQSQCLNSELINTQADGSSEQLTLPTLLALPPPPLLHWLAFELMDVQSISASIVLNIDLYHFHVLNYRSLN